MVARKRERKKSEKSDGRDELATVPQKTEKKKLKKPFERKNVPAHGAHLESGQGGRFGSWPVAPRVRGRARAGRRGYFAGSEGEETFSMASLSRREFD